MNNNSSSEKFKANTVPIRDLQGIDWSKERFRVLETKLDYKVKEDFLVKLLVVEWFKEKKSERWTPPSPLKLAGFQVREDRSKFNYDYEWILYIDVNPKLDKIDGNWLRSLGMLELNQNDGEYNYLWSNSIPNPVRQEFDQICSELSLWVKRNFQSALPLLERKFGDKKVTDHLITELKRNDPKNLELFFKEHLLEKHVDRSGYLTSDYYKIDKEVLAKLDEVPNEKLLANLKTYLFKSLNRIDLTDENNFDSNIDVVIQELPKYIGEAKVAKYLNTFHDLRYLQPWIRGDESYVPLDKIEGFVIEGMLSQSANFSRESALFFKKLTRTLIKLTMGSNFGKYETITSQERCELDAYDDEFQFETVYLGCSILKTLRVLEEKVGLNAIKNIFNEMFSTTTFRKEFLTHLGSFVENYGYYHDDEIKSFLDEGLYYGEKLLEIL